MRTRLALLAAVVLGILATIGVRMYVTQVDKRATVGLQRARIAVARVNLNRGGLLRDADIEPVAVDLRSITEDHILYDQRKPYLQTKLTRKVKAKSPLTKSAFVITPRTLDVATKTIETKWRAITLGTDQIAGVAGLITPNSRIDILGTFREPGRGPETAATTVTKAIARNVQVIAVDHRTSIRVPVGGRGRALDYGYSSVTIHVTPLEAALLTFAQGVGKLTLALRNPGDQYAGDPIPHITLAGFDDLVDRAAADRLAKTTGERSP